MASLEQAEMKEIRMVPDEDHRVEWSYEATKELLKMYDEKSDMLDTGIINTQKKLWELTSKALAKKGFFYTAPQCENKWKALKRAYRTKLDRIEKFGSYKRTSPFENEVAEILSKRPNDTITRSYSFKIHAMKKDEDLFSNINLNEPPGFAKDPHIKQEEQESKNFTFLEETQDEDSMNEQSAEFSQPAYTIIQQEPDSQNLLAEEVAGLKRIVSRQGKISTQILRGTTKVQEKILNCLERAAETQVKALEIEERKVKQQNEIINQMKLQNQLLQNLIEKFA